MSSSNPESEIRPLSADEVDATAGALHVHLKGLLHLAIGQHGVIVLVAFHPVVAVAAIAKGLRRTIVP